MAQKLIVFDPLYLLIAVGVLLAVVLLAVVVVVAIVVGVSRHNRNDD